MNTATAIRDCAYNDEQRPRLRLHGFRLDYAAAAKALAAGGGTARVALAAGSKATNRKNLRRVGMKIIRRLADSGVVYETFARLGYQLEEFCGGVIEATKATRSVRAGYRGRTVCTLQEPDWKARTAARNQYMRAVGMERLPRSCDPTLETTPTSTNVPAELASLLSSRSADDWRLLGALSSNELVELINVVRGREKSEEPKR